MTNPIPEQLKAWAKSSPIYAQICIGLVLIALSIGALTNFFGGLLAFGVVILATGILRASIEGLKERNRSGQS